MAAAIVAAVVGLVAVNLSSDDEVDTRPGDGVLGAAAVSEGLGVDLSSDAEFEQACDAYRADPDGFAEEAADKSRPIGGDRIKPIPADVHEWASFACD